MNWKLVIRDGVIEDMTEAVRWYEQKQPLLGEEFIEEVENTLAAIKANPHIYQVQRKTIRHGYVSRFPYKIFEQIIAISPTLTLNIASHPKGIYFIKIINNETVSVHKIIYQ